MESPSTLPKRGQSPLPFLKGHAYRFGENIVYGLILAVAVSGLSLAAATTGGRPRLVGVGAAMSGFMALAQIVGATLAGQRQNGLAVFLAAKWVLIVGVLGLPFVFAAIGIPLATATTAFLGAGIGIVANMVAWVLGIKYLYRPAELPRWWWRLSVQAFAFAGAIAALAVSAL
ncbi:hypothetical protein ACIA5D_37120 [Actinoplanes sp. NPDC051513]|uniref:hypothetical protein n=1 Tax=Actinoplanes sp. NPDC051513 TaxID=3363908 RepID=UPI0037A39CE9